MGQHPTPESITRRRMFVAGLCALFVIFVLVIGYFMSKGSIDVFSPVGTIGRQERNLIILATLLSLIVVLPVFAMTFGIAWRYRASNTRAHYTPEWDHNRVAESIWWLVPLVLISVLAVVTWHSTHALDPNKALAAETKPLTIQVVALQWRWLFLYPEQGVASLNYVQFPEDTPVHFQITADAPMNSFWIPKLGGQIYAMAGMSTNLNLIADDVGNYRGSSANLSGAGFSDMNFTARASSQSEYAKWLESARQQVPLNADLYEQLAKPSSDKQVSTYALSQTDLYDNIMHKYMAHAGGHTE